MPSSSSQIMICRAGSSVPRRCRYPVQLELRAGSTTDVLVPLGPCCYADGAKKRGFAVEAVPRNETSSEMARTTPTAPHRQHHTDSTTPTAPHRQHQASKDHPPTTSNLIQEKFQTQPQVPVDLLWEIQILLSCTSGGSSAAAPTTPLRVALVASPISMISAFPSWTDCPNSEISRPTGCV